MQAISIVLFTALMLGFFILFLTPGRWWPRRPSADNKRDHVPRVADEDDPPQYPRSLN